MVVSVYQSVFFLAVLVRKSFSSNTNIQLRGLSVLVQENFAWSSDSNMKFDLVSCIERETSRLTPSQGQFPFYILFLSRTNIRS